MIIYYYIQEASSIRSLIDTDTHPIMGLYLSMRRLTTFDTPIFFFFLSFFLLFKKETKVYYHHLTIANQSTSQLLIYLEYLIFYFLFFNLCYPIDNIPLFVTQFLCNLFCLRSEQESGKLQITVLKDFYFL